MPKDYYVPRGEKAKGVWANILLSKFTANAPALGFLPADITALANDVAQLNYQINMAELLTTSKLQRTEFKNLMINGPLGKVAGAAPLAPVIPAAPAAVAPGILPRIALLVQRIKTSPNYNEAIGKDLGIIGAEQEHDFTVAKPALKLVKTITHVDVQWTKGEADAVYIETDKGTGTWQFLAVDSVPHYQDTTPVTGAGLWKYRACYMVNDERIGQWSDVASIAVG